jgi:ferritin-like protein
MVERSGTAILQFFEYSHLKPELQRVSKHFYDLAEYVVDHLKDNTERAECLRKLLEAKDCAVRAYIYKEPSNG